MKAYIVQNKNLIEPFLIEAEKLFIGNKKLETLQKKAIQKTNLIPVLVNNQSEINDNNEHIILSNNLYFEASLLKKFLKYSKKLKSPTVCSVKRGIFTERTFTKLQEIKETIDSIEYNLNYIPQKKFRENPKQPIVFNLDKNLEHIYLPEHIYKGGKYSIPLTSTPIIQIDHWSNLWSANLSFILSELSRINESSKVRFILPILKNLSFNRWNILKSSNKIGKNCDIHPTAYIEGSSIGDNVVIGAGSVIRESIIGENSFLGNGIIIENTVIGNKCTILSGHILYSVLFSNVFTVTQMISASVVGKGSFLGSGSILTDFRLDGKTMKVIKEGKTVDTDNIFLGCCLGNNVYLGAGCVIAPGRTIKNDLHICLDSNRIVTSIGEDNKISGFKTI